MVNKLNLARVNKAFRDHKVYEAIFGHDELEEFISFLLAVKLQLEQEGTDTAVLGFLTEPEVSSASNADLKIGRLVVFFGCDTITRDQDHSKKYSTEELVEKLVDFIKDIGLN